jgi:uncharacterized protein (TIGR00251 family)
MVLQRIRVTANAKQESIHDDGKVVRISVTVPAAHNQANVRALALLKTFRKAKRVELVSGHHRPNKVVRLRD